MEVKPGYQQTDLGTIPQDWSEASLTSVIEKGSRITYGVVQPGKNDADGVLFIRGGDILAGRVIESQLRRIPKAVSDKYQRTCLSGGEILISLVGYPGEAALVPKRLAGANIARQVALVRLNTDLPISGEFVCKFLQSDVGRRQLLREAIGSAQQVINLRDIKNVALALPPTDDEQRVIAAALNDMDALLDGLDRLIATKRDLKQAVMQQLLTGRARLPGFQGDWETRPARDIGRFKGGTGFPLIAQGQSGGSYPFFKVSDMNNEGNETFMTAANHYVSEQTRKRLGATAFPADSIVFAKVGAAVFLERKKILTRDSCIDNNMAAFVLDKSRADVTFYHALLLSKKLGDLVTTTALPALNARQLGEMSMAVPPLAEQRAIAAVISDMDAELLALEARRDKTRALKQAMMQELLTGRTRLI